MPYIRPAIRDLLRIEEAGDTPQTPGELNYCFTVLIHRYLQFHGQSYQRFNDAIGALEGAKLELYRRHVAPYEDQKIKENGDVPEGDPNV